ncbi:hypothetical protein E1A91_D07G232900v1 [Gossypium mustelinum]|uniref:CDC45-like protein n=1 Tax=Gossypium mustelinum TaxID=34275 RepID=A0A5D2UFI4_GOSMU|nr:hypothetical protein E1A91_D07G232900v1 [Gossypium mustelinum]
MVREERVESFCARLRASSLSPLLIFPSTSDVDSLCALKIIFHILESDSVREYAASELSSSSEEPVSMLLINWGCHPARVFVVDSHRPIHLHNLSDQNDQVVVLCTKDDERLADLAYDFEVMELANASYCLQNSELDGEEDEDSESDDEDEEVEGRARDGFWKRRRLSSEGEEEPPARHFKKLKREYYRMGTFHGKPSGCLMYDLSRCLRKNTNELLWLACVSLTDQFVHERLTDVRYEAGVMEPQQQFRESGCVTSGTLKDGTKVRAPDSSKIVYEEEPRLMLLREWNLFDSMLCSSYIAPKLKTWSDNGLKKLKLLLARMGFALVDCQQKFEYMNHEVTQKMKNQFEQILPEYGLNDFYYKSFLRLHGYTSRVSAADMVYGDGLCAVKQFGVAYDALSLSNLDKLKSGMQQAIKIQRAILRQGSAAITNNSVDTKLLGHPKARTKFCCFLMDALKEKGAELNPLLCACMLQEPSKVLIVGVCGKPLLGALQGNAFGLAFRKAAEETGAQFFHELFETSWIVLDAGVVNSFMIKLTVRL